MAKPKPEVPRRERLIAAGMCTICGQRVAKEHRLNCSVCLEKASARSRLRTKSNPYVTGILPQVPVEEKICPRCSLVKPSSEFAPSKWTRDGIANWCRDCYNLNRKRLRQNEDKALRKVQGRRRNLKKLYGMTLEQFDELLSFQGHRCAICHEQSVDNSPGGVFHVDHDHNTGTVRGLLCSDCNLGIGKLGDSVDGILSALAYLQHPPATNLMRSKIEMVGNA